MYRNNSSLVLLASGARTTTQTITTSVQGNKLENLGGCGLRVILNTTVIGTGSITVSIEGITANGLTHTLLAGAAVTTNTTKVYEIFPGAPVTANVSANTFLSKEFQVTVTANNANSATYSVSCDILR